MYLFCFCVLYLSKQLKQTIMKNSNYKGFDIVLEAVKNQIICKAYKRSEIVKKQRFFFYTKEQALKQFKQALN